MDWNNNGSRTLTIDPNFVSPPPQSSSALLYNSTYNYDPELEMEKRSVEAEQGVVWGGADQRKKRLSEKQLEWLERSFQEEVKLGADRKMKLSKELGLQPRQIAVWFQNRRARWKTKQLEHLYETLKQDFANISREKHDLQQQVKKLRSMLKEQAVGNQGWSMAFMDISREEETTTTTTVESTSAGVRSCDNYIYNNDVEISASAPPLFWWGAEATHLPSFP